LTVEPTEPLVIADQYLDADAEDEDDDYLPRPQVGRRIPALTAALLLAILATGAFFSGVEVQKRAGKAKATNTSAALATAGATGNTNGAAATGTGGAAGFGGSGRAGGRSIGLVTNVQPGVISITDAQGNVVKITTTANPTVSKSTQGTLSDIQIGNTIVVQGQQGSDGSVKATSITVGSLSGGFGGSGGGGGSGAGGSGAGGSGAGGSGTGGGANG
jgi:hypothetical protein